MRDYIPLPAALLSQGCELDFTETALVVNILPAEKPGANSQI
jgi:hypothetical protein